MEHKQVTVLVLRKAVPRIHNLSLHAGERSLHSAADLLSAKSDPPTLPTAHCTGG
jgi:hypothetical protein